MPCDPKHIGRFGKMIGEETVEQLLIATIEAAVSSNSVKPSEFERVIVDTIKTATVYRMMEYPRSPIELRFGIRNCLIYSGRVNINSVDKYGTIRQHMGALPFQVEISIAEGFFSQH